MGLEAKVSSEYTVGGGDGDVMNKEASWGRPKKEDVSATYKQAALVRFLFLNSHKILVLIPPPHPQLSSVFLLPSSFFLQIACYLGGPPPPNCSTNSIIRLPSNRMLPLWAPPPSTCSSNLIPSYFPHLLFSHWTFIFLHVHVLNRTKKT